MKDFIGIFKVSHKNKELINELYRFNTLLPTYTQFGNSFGRIRTLLTCSSHDVADYISSNYTLSELFGDNGKYTKIGQNFKIYKTKVCNAHSLYSGIYYIPYNNKVLEEVITKEYLVTSRSYKNKPYYQVYTTSQQDVEQLLSLCNEPENCIIEHGNINMNTLPEMKSILNIIGKKLGNVCSKSLGYSGIYITNTNITIRVVPTIAANTTVVVSLISNINDIDRENITSILRTNGVVTSL